MADISLHILWCVLSGVYWASAGLRFAPGFPLTPLDVSFSSIGGIKVDRILMWSLYRRKLEDLALKSNRLNALKKDFYCISHLSILLHWEELIFYRWVFADGKKERYVHLTVMRKCSSHFMLRNVNRNETIFHLSRSLCLAVPLSPLSPSSFYMTKSTFGLYQRIEVSCSLRALNASAFMNAQQAEGDWDDKLWFVCKLFLLFCICWLPELFYL